MSTQKRIRDLQRLLAKKGGDLEAAEAIKVKIQRLTETKIANVEKEKEKRNATKYHMVKFFERKKLTRKIRKIDAELKSVTDRKQEKALKIERQRVIEDLAYVMYYPNKLKYVALFHDDGSSTADTQLKAEARTVALRLWREDSSKATEGEDRVQHAIRVAYDAKARKRNATTTTSNDSFSDASFSSDNEQESEVLSGEKDEMITSNKSAESVNTESQAFVGKKSKKRVREDQQATTPEPLFEPDAFFIEETTEDNKDRVDNIAELETRAKSSGRVMRFPRGKIQHGGGSSGEASKQESRLRAWQQGRRGRGHGAPGRSYREDSSRKTDHVRGESSGTGNFSFNAGKNHRKVG